MTREKALSELSEIAKSSDQEVTHVDADEVLCQLLVALGYQDVVNAWDEIPKWYA